jgi:hypothetical protein
MMQMRGVSQGLDLGWGFVESSVVNRVAAWARKDQVSYREATQMSELAILRQQKGARGLSRHSVMSVVERNTPYVRLRQVKQHKN